LLLTQLDAEIRRTRTRGAAVLAGFGIKLGLIPNGAAGALEEQIGAFTA
jgi:hypothetical protein